MEASVTLYHNTRRALKDGRFPIRIRITYRGYQRYYKTGYLVASIKAMRPPVEHPWK
jgi:hypothetical protein